jgi:hypothetical protein
MHAEILVCVCVCACAFACVMILINVHLAYREGDWRRGVRRQIEASFFKSCKVVRVGFSGINFPGYAPKKLIQITLQQ